MKKISFYNHKGGVGKTTSVINVAYYLQKNEKKVLVVDCDSQKNSVYSPVLGFFDLRIKSEEVHPTKYDNISLTNWENFKSQEALGEEFDYVLFDLPPALTSEVKEIIRVSNVVFVPIILGEFEIHGLSDVTAEIKKQGTKLGGVFVTMFRKKSDEESVIMLEKIIKKRLMNTIIPFSCSVRESQKCGLSLEEFFNERNTPKTKNARKIAYSYENLAKEIIERISTNGNV
jgi:chromosome partitioning protein